MIIVIQCSNLAALSPESTRDQTALGITYGLFGCLVPVRCQVIQPTGWSRLQSPKPFYKQLSNDKAFEIHRRYDIGNADKMQIGCGRLIELNIYISLKISPPVFWVCVLLRGTGFRKYLGRSLKLNFNVRVARRAS